jgi:hypothetical protein
MMSGVIGARGQNCSLRVLIILASEFVIVAKPKTLKHGGKEEAEDLRIGKFAPYELAIDNSNRVFNFGDFGNSADFGNLKSPPFLLSSVFQRFTAPPNKQTTPWHSPSARL